MCGLAGFFSKQGIGAEKLKQISAALRHRGPDDEGFYCVQDGVAASFRGADTTGKNRELPQLPQGSFEIALLHRRLSILELSDLGHQPMISQDGDLVLVFNGEIYNFRELLKKHNLEHRQQSNCDTEALLHLYQAFGPAIFKELRGMWAIAIYHPRKNKLVLSRDRFGIKPLYYAVDKGFFAFSSELKPLLLCPEVPPEVAADKVLEYLFYGAPSDPAAIFFDRIKEVSPAGVLEVDMATGHLQESIFYMPGAEKPAGTFAELFNQSVQEHLLSDVPVGSCLSGGLDSSSIVAAAADIVSHPVKTFTCAFPGTDVDESGYAKLLANYKPNLRQYFVMPVAEEFLQDMDRLISVQELPIASSSVYAQYRVMQLAAGNGCKVLLDGQGADEIFGGYYNFAGLFLWNLLLSGKLKAFGKGFRDLEQNFSPTMLKAMVRASYYHLPNTVQKMGRRTERLGAGLIHSDYSPRLKTLKGPERGGNNFTRLSISSLKYGLRELLRYEDRNSMAFSVESRVPFLDHRVVDYALNLKPDEKIVNGWTKYPIRQYLQKHNMQELAWRKDKKGFVTPQQLWRRQTLPTLKDQLSNTDIPDFIDKKALQQLLSADLASNEHLSEFWRIFALLRWIRLFNVQVR